MVGWRGKGEEEGTKSNSPPGTDDKALVSETKNRVRATSILRGSFVVDESRFEDFLARKILARSA